MHRVVLSDFFDFTHLVEASIKLKKRRISKQLAILGKFLNDTHIDNDHLTLSVNSTCSTDIVFCVLFVFHAFGGVPRVLDQNSAGVLLVGVLVILDLVWL